MGDFNIGDFSFELAFASVPSSNATLEPNREFQSLIIPPYPPVYSDFSAFLLRPWKSISK